MSHFFAGVVYETAIPAAIAIRQLAMNPNSYFKTFVAVRAIINTVRICRIIVIAKRLIPCLAEVAE